MPFWKRALTEMELAQSLRSSIIYPPHRHPLPLAILATVKMSAQNSVGIQTLLDSEREAQKIVQKAREYRTKRVKDARSEAQKEIEEYRKQKDQEFKKFESEHTSGNRKAEENAAKDAENKVKEIKEAGKKTGDTVIEELLKAIMDIKPEVPDRVAAPPRA
ncbi:MAG: H(+)-transporting V1 sector ATPase subunit G [Pleopsidium flavum]|nr:MAG: H(+)-transporting V1 sector ATPase subunit G [Pleopsidium flavum]